MLRTILMLLFLAAYSMSFGSTQPANYSCCRTACMKANPAAGQSKIKTCTNRCVRYENANTDNMPPWYGTYTGPQCSTTKPTILRLDE